MLNTNIHLEKCNGMAQCTHGIHTPADYIWKYMSEIALQMPKNGTKECYNTILCAALSVAPILLPLDTMAPLFTRSAELILITSVEPVAL